MTTTSEKAVLLALPVKDITADGSGIWGKNSGTVRVDHVKILYRGERVSIFPGSPLAAYYGPNGYKVRQHISVDVDGPSPLPFWYTDNGAEKQVEAAFKAELLKETGADDLQLSWSEHGMQGDASWNFDVNLFWK